MSQLNLGKDTWLKLSLEGLRLILRLINFENNSSYMKKND